MISLLKQFLTFFFWAPLQPLVNATEISASEMARISIVRLSGELLTSVVRSSGETLDAAVKQWQGMGDM